MRSRHARLILASAIVSVIVGTGSAQASTDTGAEWYSSVIRLKGPSAGTLLTAGLQGSTGATVGPDGAVYIAEGGRGRIVRVDSKGRTSTYASGFTPSLIPGLGGVIDVAFVDRTAWALVTAVNADFGGKGVAGLYRRDAAGRFRVVADLAAYSAANPPTTPFDLPGGVQFSLQPVPDGFLVTDGHHNRILHVTASGVITQRIQLENVVPTGMAVRDGTVYVAQLGPIPHTPASGKITTFPLAGAAAVMKAAASGARMAVDVEFSSNGTMYALSQGVSPAGANPGEPAGPHTGALLRVLADGTMTTIVRSLDRPTSIDFIGESAYVTTMAGEVWKIANVSKLGQ